MSFLESDDVQQNIRAWDADCLGPRDSDTGSFGKVNPGQTTTINVSQSVLASFPTLATLRPTAFEHGGLRYSQGRAVWATDHGVGEHSLRTNHDKPTWQNLLLPPNPHCLEDGRTEEEKASEAAMRSPHHETPGVAVLSLRGDGGHNHPLSEIVVERPASARRVTAEEFAIVVLGKLLSTWRYPRLFRPVSSAAQPRPPNRWHTSQTPAGSGDEEDEPLGWDGPVHYGSIAHICEAWTARQRPRALPVVSGQGAVVVPVVVPVVVMASFCSASSKASAPSLSHSLAPRLGSLCYRLRL